MNVIVEGIVAVINPVAPLNMLFPITVNPEIRSTEMRLVQLRKALLPIDMIIIITIIITIIIKIIIKYVISYKCY